MASLKIIQSLVNYEPGNNDVLTFGLNMEYSTLQNLLKMYMPLDYNELENCIEVSIEKVDGTYDGCKSSEWEIYSLNVDIIQLHQILSGHIVFNELNWGTDS